MQVYQLSDIPKRLQGAIARFSRIAAKTLSAKAAEILRYDWAYRLYINSSHIENDETFYFMKPPMARIFRGGRRI